MKWEIIDDREYKDEKGYCIREKVERAMIHEGWLVKSMIYSRSVQTLGRSGGIGVGIGAGSGITFVPDPSHSWTIKKKQQSKKYK